MASELLELKIAGNSVSAISEFVREEHHNADDWNAIVHRLLGIARSLSADEERLIEATINDEFTMAEEYGVLLKQVCRGGMTLAEFLICEPKLMAALGTDGVRSLHLVAGELAETIRKVEARWPKPIAADVLDAARAKSLRGEYHSTVEEVMRELDGHN